MANSVMCFPTVKKKFKKKQGDKLLFSKWYQGKSERQPTCRRVYYSEYTNWDNLIMSKTPSK